MFWKNILIGVKEMQKLMDWLERFIIPIATRIGSQKHLVAMRDAFIATLPATMAGSVAVLLNAFVRDFPTNWGLTNFVEAMSPVISVNGFVWTGTLAIMAVILSSTLGYNLAKVYKVDPLSGAVVSLAAFFMGLSQTATTNLELTEALPSQYVDLITEAGGTVINGTTISTGAWGYFNFGAHMGGTGIFTALIIGFLSTIIFAKLMLANITIKMPEQVPPAVSKAFAAIIPATLSLFTIGILNYIFTQLTDGEIIIDWIARVIQAPMLEMSQGFGAVILIVFLVHLLWFFGIHGTNVMAPVLQTLYGSAMTENMNAYQSQEAVPYRWVAGSFEAFVWPGGAGVTLMLLLAILIFSKKEDIRAVGKIGLGPGIFNINEPVMFGLPIVLNPIYMIPFILAPLATSTIAYTATMLNLVNPVVVSVIWVMPAGVSGFLATGGDWRAIVLTIVNLGVAFMIWAPFILSANKISRKSVDDVN